MSAVMPPPMRAGSELVATAAGAPRILFLTLEDWYFMLHPVALARTARAAGYEVHVATRVREHGPQIEAEGFRLHPIDLRRGSLDPILFLRTAYRLRRLYRSVRPHIVHHVTLHASLLGAVAARGLGVPQVNALVGLGYVFIAPSLKARAVRAVVARALPWLTADPLCRLVLENANDRAEMLRLGVAPERTAVIAGAAFDVAATPLLPEPEGPPTIAFVGRFVEDKGVRTLIEAHRRLVQAGNPVRLLLAGEVDPPNPASIPAAEFDAWARLPQVVRLGYVTDIARVWAQAHIAVLPSRREGLPQSLLEAAAFGRPLIAADVPGCRDIVRPEINGLLVPPDDPSALAAAIERLAADPALRQRLGAAGRRLVEERFSNLQAGRQFLALYEELRAAGRNSSQ